MTPKLSRLPAVFTITACAAMAAYGPITQLEHYHEFADHTHLGALQHAGDVLSNLIFGAVALWGIARLWPKRKHPALQAGLYGYALFLLGLLLTTIGSSYYHLAPDNARLVWDRLPIAWATAGLLIAVRAETRPVGQRRGKPLVDTALLAGFATFSALWWRFTELHGVGDLRPYLLLQGLALVLIPLWQALHRTPLTDRLLFGLALLLYVAAKIAELHDVQLQASLHLLSGHTLKHLLAGIAAFILTTVLVRRTQHESKTEQLPTPPDIPGNAFQSRRAM